MGVWIGDGLGVWAGVSIFFGLGAFVKVVILEGVGEYDIDKGDGVMS